MAIDGPRPTERQRGEWVLALEGMRDLAQEALDDVNEGAYNLALVPLSLIQAGALPLRNAIGQWVNSMVCPFCGKEGPNIAVPRESGNVIDIGFKCAHCKRDWGFEVLKDERA